MNSFECGVCHNIFQTKDELPELADDVVMVCDECNTKLTEFFGTNTDDSEE